MNNNVVKFRKLLHERDVQLEERVEEDKTFFIEEITIYGGPRIEMIALFTEDDSYVGIDTSNYIKVTDTSKKEYVLNKINELNRKYKYSKFLLDADNNISINVNIPFIDNFNPEIVWKLLLMVDELLRDEYKEFMKIIWS